MQVKDMAIGAEIFMKHCPDDLIEADHDVIFGPSPDSINLSAQEKKILEDAGWYVHEEHDCWSHHC